MIGGAGVFVGVGGWGIVGVGMGVSGGSVATGGSGVKVATGGGSVPPLAVGVGVGVVGGSVTTGVLVLVATGVLVLVATGVFVLVATGVLVLVATGVFVGVAGVLVQPETVLVSMVTAPVRAKTRPLTLTPVVSVSLARASRLPWNIVPVPSVAELPTCQNTLHAEAPLIRTTDEALAVVSVLPI